jgi:hypothetical protein
MEDNTEHGDIRRAKAVVVQDNKNNSSFRRVIETVIAAAIIGAITMFGTIQAVSTKIDYLNDSIKENRVDVKEMRALFMEHIQKSK